ncbi:MAG: homoserine kinase [Magnetococcales bacterium]|nr:homoserine kinase [Magnetococcales bacterium]
MSVYTRVTPEDLTHWLPRFDIGQLHRLEGISDGVVNTNYRLLTDQGKYILTLVEDPREARGLPYSTFLLSHLAKRHIPCPLPVADRKGIVLQQLKERPTLIVTLLPGRSPQTPTPRQCHTLGEMLAKLHQAGRDFPKQRPNPMGDGMLTRIFAQLQPLLEKQDPATAALLQEEMVAMTKEFAAKSLPMGVCHADLFPDNTLFEGDRLTGVIDFHYSCQERWVLDLAITLNAWCLNDQGEPDQHRLGALWEGYRTLRPLEPQEMAALNLALRAAALRFSLTRLKDQLFPRQGDQVTRKPPKAFLNRLRFHQKTDLTAFLSSHTR